MPVDADRSCGRPSYIFHHTATELRDGSADSDVPEASDGRIELAWSGRGVAAL